MHDCVDACVSAYLHVCASVRALVNVELMDITKQLAELHQNSYRKVLFPAELQLPLLMSIG